MQRIYLTVVMILAMLAGLFLVIYAHEKLAIAIGCLMINLVVILLMHMYDNVTIEE